MELAERKKKILSYVIESYIRTGEPVGSKTLISETGLDVSSATVRNDMADLTNKGYLIQPHTSAGRIPTQQGYRYYVDNVMNVKPMSQGSREYIQSVLSQSADSPESILQKAADLIAELTELVTVATTPSSVESRIRKISFVRTGSRTAMVVVMTSNGIIKTKLFRCEFIITDDLLEVFDKALNSLFAGVKLDSINMPFIQTAAAKFGELSLFMPSVLMAIMDSAKQAKETGIFHSSYSALMFMPDSDFIKTRALLEFLNNLHDVAAMLDKMPYGSNVTIGSENSRIELAANSVISTRYTVNSDHSGVIAAVAPLRTDYARIISIIECVAKCTEDLIDELTEI